MSSQPFFPQPQAVIPFTLHDRAGRVAVYYGPSDDASKAGFDALPGLNLPLDACVGYPVMEARIESYAGSGYRTLCGWIQVITRHDTPTDQPGAPTVVSRSVDVAPSMEAAQIPFAVFGCLPTFLDAPCLNLGNNAALTWIADTFLVTLPLRSREEEVDWLLGFRWGYREYNPQANKPVELLPLVVTDGGAWQEQVGLLRGECAGWRFGEVGEAKG